jgi:hypothetical protein
MGHDLMYVGSLGDGAFLSVVQCHQAGLMPEPSFGAVNQPW